jgi:2,4-dienoyl-CoA reductase-like NADH-dependent reductase (Old Yellow Enzyme family)/thioredoxin reductase
MSAMSTHMIGPGGSVSPQQIAYYRERALGGTALVTVEYACVSPEGKARDWQLVLDSPANIPGHIKLVESIKDAGAHASLQLHHAGRQTHPATIGGRQPVAPSAVESKYFGPAAIARALASPEIDGIIESFAKSAKWAVEAGYDVIELHAAHGYLLGQFLSPLTNRRDDEWGGDFERRLRFPTAVIAAVKSVIGPDRPLIYRFSGDEFVPGGLTIEDSEKIAPHLVAAGADALHVSAGIMDCMEYVIEPMSMPEGWRLYLSRRVKSKVQVPVVTVGQVRQPATAERALVEGDADLIALGRPLLVDPFWPAKARSGRVDAIRPCTSCNWCIGPAGKHRGVGCAENPRAGRELDDALTDFGKGRDAVVLGAGPGGIVAALLLDQAGFKVALHETRPGMGGGLIVSGAPPHKENLLAYLKYLERRLAETRVSVHLNSTLTEEQICALNPAAVILAIGSVPLPMDIAGIDGPSVHQAFDVLLGDDDAAHRVKGKTVVVYGGGETGCETAEFLSERGARVLLITRSPQAKLARSAERLYRKQLRERLAKNANIEVIENSRLVRIGPEQVTIEGADGSARTQPASAVFMAQGRRAARPSLGALESRGIRAACIGDANEIGRIGEAVADAYRVVMALERRLEPVLLAC